MNSSANSGSQLSVHSTLMEQPTPTRRLKFIAGADSFGSDLKDALVSHLRSLDIEVEDIGTSNYYSIGEKIGQRVSQSTKELTAVETRGLVACGTGVGVGIFANKFPGVYAATCTSPADAINARSISDCNVLAVSGMYTSNQTGIEILSAFLDTEFKSPCPASGSEPWPEEIEAFLDGSVEEMSRIGEGGVSVEDSPPCCICSLAKSREDKEFVPVDDIPGGFFKILRVKV